MKNSTQIILFNYTYNFNNKQSTNSNFLNLHFNINNVEIPLLRVEVVNKVMEFAKAQITANIK